MNAITCTNANDFLDMFMVNSMYPLIHFPTRITRNKCSLLDNIFTNNLDYMLTGVLSADISDHLAVFGICHKQGGNKIYCTAQETEL